ncbi:hypothetical protein, partial [cf. Phormidesmis sp. LEGE 11477]|uniref:hypothetical protein n=1 Tax=cf. Phormidesmis sp. LEGE 11477 TaxID=1828680 RepID=UPI001882E079
MSEFSPQTARSSAAATASRQSRSANNNSASSAPSGTPLFLQNQTVHPTPAENAAQQSLPQTSVETETTEINSQLSNQSNGQADSQSNDVATSSQPLSSSNSQVLQTPGTELASGSLLFLESSETNDTETQSNGDALTSNSSQLSGQQGINQMVRPI